MTDRCIVCRLKIRLVSTREGRSVWIHDDLRYGPFGSPLHAAKRRDQMAKYRFVVEVKINNPPATYEDEILDEIAEWLDSAQQEFVYWTTDDGDEKEREIKDWTVRLYLGRLDTDPED